MCSNSSNLNKPLVIWRFTDGKPGHEAQSQGLADAFGRMVPLELVDIPVASLRSAFFEWIRGRFSVGGSFSKPDLLVGAGHATHWPMLAARRAYGGRIVVLMRPSLPLRCFDYIVIPEHDNPPDRAKVFTTKGVLNPIVASEERDRSKGLILIGGQSRHYEWNDMILKQQLDCLLSHTSDIQWWLTTSRRTPASTLDMLHVMDWPNLKLVPHTETAAGWVARHLQDCGQAWVTPDSVSMLYEALTACDHVGIIKTSLAGGRSRVAAAVEKMIAEKQLSVLEDPAQEPQWHEASKPLLAEAERVARHLLREHP